jgi:Kdo2-lipid IVA lauroyltransferase/acyltransferase
MVSPLMYACFGSRRRIVLKNLSTCFPDKNSDELGVIAKRCFCLTIQTGMSTGINWWASEARLAGMISVSGREHYDNALANGRNIILLAPHVIALEVGGFELSRERPMITMYQRTKNPLVDATIESARSRYGGALVERKEPLRNLLKLIRQGKPFYYLPDQDGGRKGVFVPFFSAQASTIPMIGKFAALCDAVVIPCFTRIKPRGAGWVVELGEAIDSWPSNNIAAATLMNQVIENWVKHNPEQYFWLHKRFKTRPLGEEAFYE